METGVGYRQELSLWVDGAPPHIDFLEVLAEEFVRPELQNRLAALAARYPLAIRGRELSLGTPGPLDGDRLGRIADLVAVSNPLWLSERIAFSRTGEVDLACANPITHTDDTIKRIADHAREVSDRCGTSLLLENIASHLRIAGTMPETDFVNRLCETSGFGLLLDLTSLFVDSRNHDFDPHRWLREIDPRHIRQLHISGFSRTEDRWDDRHRERPQSEIWKLAETALSHAAPRGAIIEYDVCFPAADAIEEDLRFLRKAGGIAA